jgi:hypothetical protein
MVASNSKHSKGHQLQQTYQDLHGKAGLLTTEGTSATVDLSWTSRTSKSSRDASNIRGVPATEGRYQQGQATSRVPEDLQIQNYAEFFAILYGILNTKNK